MSKPGEPAKVSMHLVPGLVDYYSSQADLMLSQYQNINLLLGDTTDCGGTDMAAPFRRVYPPHQRSEFRNYFSPEKAATISYRHTVILAEILAYDKQEMSS